MRQGLEPQCCLVLSLAMPMRSSALLHVRNLHLRPQSSVIGIDHNHCARAGSLVSSCYNNLPLAMEATKSDDLGSLVDELSRLNSLLHDLIDKETSGHPVVEKPEIRLAIQEKPTETVHIPSQLRLTQENLLGLRDRFLSMFDVASILGTRALPWYHIQHDIVRVGSSHSLDKDLSAVDSRTEYRAAADSWSEFANLQFEAVHRKTATDRRSLIVPLAHFQLHPHFGPTARDNIEEAAALVKALWPNEKIRRPKRKLLGPSLGDHRNFEGQLLRWLAARDLNSEVVTLALFPRLSSGEFLAQPMADDVSRATTGEPQLKTHADNDC